jgi:hypothetical protein
MMGRVVKGFVAVMFLDLIVYHPVASTKPPSRASNLIQFNVLKAVNAMQLSGKCSKESCPPSSVEHCVGFRLKSRFG